MLNQNVASATHRFLLGLHLWSPFTAIWQHAIIDLSTLDGNVFVGDIYRDVSTREEWRILRPVYQTRVCKYWEASTKTSQLCWRWRPVHRLTRFIGAADARSFVYLSNTVGGTYWTA